MKNKGFYLKELKVTGIGVEPSQIKFEKGFNVIDGASNTGKSYIVKCIDYIFGSDTPPKKIKESIGYTDVYMEIRRFDNDKPITLKRSLIERKEFYINYTDILRFETTGNPVKLKLKPKANEPSLSSYLLPLINLEDKKVKKNARNVKKILTFRDIARLILIQEQRIIGEDSPAYGGQKTNITTEESVLNLLLSGKDDDYLETKEKPEIRKGKINAKIELIINLLTNLNKKLESIKVNEAEYIDLDKRVANITKHLSESSLLQEKLMMDRQSIWKDIEDKRTKLLYNEELVQRFKLLERHYRTDIARLEFIDEGESLVSQLKTVSCPVCGNNFNKEHFECNPDKLINEGSQISEALQSEIYKITAKLYDLISTTSKLELEGTELNQELDFLNRRLFETGKTLDQELEPFKFSSQNELEKLINIKNQISQITYLKSQISDLHIEKMELEVALKSKVKKNNEASLISYSIYKDFCIQIENILASWGYPINTNVEFDLDSFDIIVNNQPRINNGKGFRAIEFSAFIIGLMDFCFAKDLNHPNCIVLDSPLTAYKKSDDLEERDRLTDNIEKEFFKSLSKIEKDRQIIIFDNKEPEISIKGDINYIHFSKQKNFGRYGFFPF